MVSHQNLSETPLRKTEQRMKTVLTLLFVLFLCAPAGAQDLPPAMLADQYLLEATEAMEQGELLKAERAFKKIEALAVEPPPTFAYFYGKLLAEHGVGPEVWRKGQSLLKQFVISAGRESEYYTPTLKLLSMVEAKLEAARRAQADDAAYAAATAQDTPEGYAAYVQRYPAGRHVGAAREAQRRAKLQERLPAIHQQVNAQMVQVQGGTFTMGCTREQRPCYDHEKPAHQVQVRAFQIGKYEVTQQLWEVVMGKNPSDFDNCPQCPVEQVNWEDVQNFLKALNQTGAQYRLPTEAEWEYAARGGQQSRGYQYAGGENLDAVGWYEENSGDKPHPVGQKQANELGLYDLSGNVSEWVADWYGPYTVGPVTDPRGPAEGADRVSRGGSWINPARGCRAADRFWGSPGVHTSSLGFRLARTP